MTISAADALLLRQSGFTRYEIDEIANAKTTTGEDQPPINLRSPAWVATIKSRREWWIDKVERGWTEYEIENELMNYYNRDTNRTPFDFLRAEYKPPKKADYIEIARKRAAKQIKRELDGYVL